MPLLAREKVVATIKWLSTTFICAIFYLTAPTRWMIEAIEDILISFSKQQRPVLDIIAGILLLSQVDRKVPREKKTPLKDQQPWQVNYTAGNPEEVEKVDRFVDYAMAIYRWPLYIYLFGWLLRPKAFFWTLFYLRPFSFFFRNSFIFHRHSKFHRELVNDGFLHHKTAAFMAATPRGVSINSLKYASFVNSEFKTPYCIVDDEVTKSIVISVRGSTFLQNWFSNDAASPIPIPQELNGKNIRNFPLINGPTDGSTNNVALGLIDLGLHGLFHQRETLVKTHFSMFMQAKTIIDTIETQLLEIFSSDFVKYRRYGIVVTGHSLGAGIASLLTLMLRKKWGERVRGYCFSPPGCMISEEGLEESRKCILSFVVGDDMVPRMSLHSMKDIRMDTIWLMKQPFFREVRWPVLGKFAITVFTWPLFGPLSCITVLPQKAINIWFTATGINSRMESFFGRLVFGGPSKVSCDSLRDLDDHMIRLYTPGQLLHLTVNDQTCQVAAQWIHHEDLQQLVIGWHMIPDHLTHRVRRIVKHEKHVLDFVPYLRNIGAVRRIVELIL